MEISSELLTRYDMKPLEYYKEMFGDTLDTEMTFYQTFLIQTDHIPNKIIERLMEELGSVTLINFIEFFLGFITSVRTEYRDILQCRKLAREKINELEAKLTVL